MINYTPTPNFYDDYIAHYGVLGMRWGHRKKELMSLGLTKRQARRVIKVEKNRRKTENINKIKRSKNQFSKLIKNEKQSFKNGLPKERKEKVKEVAKTAATVGLVAGTTAYFTYRQGKINKLLHGLTGKTDLTTKKILFKSATNAGMAAAATLMLMAGSKSFTKKDGK